jgi:hypothetical protein
MAISPPKTPTMALVEDAVIRPFRVEVPGSELEDLRGRITATRFPEREPVEDPIVHPLGSPPRRRASSWRRWKHWCVTGAPSTTCGGSRRG